MALKELIKIQKELKAPKNQKNTFGKYNYRSCEDILEAVKPLANGLGCAVVLSDEIVNVGGYNYIKVTAKLVDEAGKTEECSAYAKESLNQKGMSEPQMTGSTSSYARKYALNGLFAIDDTKDDDATNKHDKTVKKDTKPELPWLNKNTDAFKKCKTAIEGGKFTLDNIKSKYRLSKEVEELLSK